MKRIGLSSEAKCAAASHCYPTEGTKIVKKKWLEEHNDLFINKMGQVFTLVDTTSHVYFMDAITGSLYAFDKCLSSEQLSSGRIYRDNEAGVRILNSKGYSL